MGDSAGEAKTTARRPSSFSRQAKQSLQPTAVGQLRPFSQRSSMVFVAVERLRCVSYSDHPAVLLTSFISISV